MLKCVSKEEIDCIFLTKETRDELLQLRHPDLDGESSYIMKDDDKELIIWQGYCSFKYLYNHWYLIDYDGSLLCYTKEDFVELYMLVDADEKEIIKQPKFVDNVVNSLIERRKIVSSQEYLNWIYDYVSLNGNIDDQFTATDEYASNISLLGDFFCYIEKIAEENRIAYEFGGESSEMGYYIKIKDKIFFTYLIIGQGAIAGVDHVINVPLVQYIEL